MIPSRPIFTAALLAALPAALPAADAPARAVTRLVPGWAEADGTRVAGLSVALSPGWKTYWRAPGDAGVPPVFDWSGSENVGSVEVIWPTPELFDNFGMTTIGYKHEVTLPLVVHPETPGKPIALKLKLDFGVCSDICVPETAEMALDIPPEAKGAADEIGAAMARAPLSGDKAGVQVLRCTLAGAGSERRFEGQFAMAAPPADATVVVEGPDGVWFDPARTRLEPGALTAEADAYLDDPARWVDRSSLRVTILGSDVGGGLGVDLKGCGTP